eukprot:5303056-Karenia_brevis.AAC.1
MKTLVGWWLRDRASAHHRIQACSRDAQQQHEDARRALRLMADGDISRCLKVLTNSGLADLSDERILDQL